MFSHLFDKDDAIFRALTSSGCVLFCNPTSRALMSYLDQEPTQDNTSERHIAKRLFTAELRIQFNERARAADDGCAAARFDAAYRQDAREFLQQYFRTEHVTRIVQNIATTNGQHQTLDCEVWRFLCTLQ